MNCPYLREAEVKFCDSSSHRKLLPQDVGHATRERCTTEHYVHCQAFTPASCGATGTVSSAESAGAAVDTCPHLRQSAMQYCGAAGVRRYVPPQAEDRLSRCTTQAFRYCEWYRGANGDHAPVHADGAPDIYGVAVPATLDYAHNHLWLDVQDGETLHIGIDGLLARLLGPLEKVEFLSAKGSHRALVVLTSCQVEFPLAFPNALPITDVNTALRTHPGRVTADPYGSGWLFEGLALTAREALTARQGLIPGRKAAGWMRSELERLTALAVQTGGGAPKSASSPATLNDGGIFVPGLAHCLERPALRRLLHEFVLFPNPEE
jgi:glycine cleavage system H lipoate-binding protein